MKHLLIACSFLLSLCYTVAQAQDTSKVHIYDPKANAMEDIRHAIAKADKEHKYVFITVGGNWCIWCRRFNELITTDPALKQIMDDNYVVVHVNYGPENKNLPTLASLDYPQRFGFPVFVILDGRGHRLHTQNSGYLEDGPGHSKTKVMEFLKQWSPKALDPDNYK